MSTDIIHDFMRADYLNVDPVIASERKAYLRRVWYSIAPEIELQYGVYNSTVAAPAAIFSQSIIETLEKWRQHTQIAQLIEDVQNDREINYPYLELFLENYRIKRETGMKSVGLVRLIFSKDITYGFGPNDKFTARGLMFSPTDLFSISPSSKEMVYVPNEQILKKRDDGTYSAVIELESDDILAAANLPTGTQLVLAQDTYGYLLEAEVIESFVGGIQEETMDNLLPQLVNGITSPVLTSRANIAAQIKSLPDITVKELSIIGVGDIESVRDKHGLFHISHGGRGDIYARTTGTLLTKTIMKKCRLVEIIKPPPHLPEQPVMAKYQCFLNRFDAPAAYTIRSVLSEGSTYSLDIVSESRGFDLRGLNFAPDIINCTESAFSVYQTIVFDFIDDNMQRYGDEANYPDEAEYLVSYEYQPHIQAIQEHCMNRSNVPIMGDLLVKAAIPCKTKVYFSVAVQPTQMDPDLNPLITAVINTVSNTGFMNVLPASLIIEAVQRLLPDGMFVSDFVMTGSLLLPTARIGCDNTMGLITHVEKVCGPKFHTFDRIKNRHWNHQAYTTSTVHYASEADKEELSFDIPPHATANTICFFTDVNDITIDIKRYNSVARLTH